MADPYRADAAIVYRYIRDHPGASVPEMADQCFAVDVADDSPSALYPKLRKVSVRRVLDSLVWMRHEGVLITAVPPMVPGMDLLTTFFLGAQAIDPARVVRTGTTVREFVAEGVTDKVSREQDEEQSALGGEAMGLYHP